MSTGISCYRSKSAASIQPEALITGCRGIQARLPVKVTSWKVDHGGAYIGFGTRRRETLG
jgi:hypothetical protein